MPSFVFDPDRFRQRDIHKAVSQNDKQRLWEEQEGRCFYCRCECVRSGRKEIPLLEQPDNLFTVDHMTPFARGGRTEPGNLIGSCKKCNWEKGDDSFADFVAKKIGERDRKKEQSTRKNVQ